MKSVRVFLFGAIILATLAAFSPSEAADGPTLSSQWKITTVKVCRSSSGTLIPTIEAIGNYPVYTFFIPRPVWTVNGNVVDAQPLYQHGRLILFELYNAAAYLKSGTKNTVKFSLPDQTSSKVFFLNDNTPASGECYEFF
ncbi:MAG TPA: hypothetical protein VMC85_07545 [Desulfomonilaceae bacterium]|nr:hypothetical protein [Desulfomonilaceae bacterium]